MSGYLKSYVAAAMEKDPAATSKIMVLFTYPGVKALMLHRPANWCYRHKMKFLARVISQHVRFWTGIEIHPGATIGKGVFIDHGQERHAPVTQQQEYIGKTHVEQAGNTGQGEAHGQEDVSALRQKGKGQNRIACYPDQHLNIVTGRPDTQPKTKDPPLDYLQNASKGKKRTRHGAVPGTVFCFLHSDTSLLIF